MRPTPQVRSLELDLAKKSAALEKKASTIGELQQQLQIQEVEFKRQLEEKLQAERQRMGRQLKDLTQRQQHAQAERERFAGELEQRTAKQDAEKAALLKQWEERSDMASGGTPLGARSCGQLWPTPQTRSAARSVITCYMSNTRTLLLPGMNTQRDGGML